MTYDTASRARIRKYPTNYAWITVKMSQIFMCFCVVLYLLVWLKSTVWALKKRTTNEGIRLRGAGNKVNTTGPLPQTTGDTTPVTVINFSSRRPQFRQKNHNNHHIDRAKRHSSPQLHHKTPSESWRPLPWSRSTFRYAVHIAINSLHRTFRWLDWRIANISNKKTKAEPRDYCTYAALES